ncbi:MAG TPA: hypothetical protein VFG50_01325 [Rhodothermales bacterium]|nr:hypothetical protein [Rhodothermales bacterium]
MDVSSPSVPPPTYELSAERLKGAQAAEQGASSKAAMGVMFSIGAIQVLIILVNMGRAKFMSVYLGPTGFGVIGTIDQVVLSLVQLAGLSLPFTALKFLSRSHSESHSRFQTSYSSFLRGMVSLSFLALLIVAALLAWKPALFGSDLVPYRDIVTVAILTVPALMLNIFFVHTLAAAQKSSIGALLSFCVTFCLACAACAGVMAGGIRMLYIATAGTGVLTTLASLFFVRHRLKLKIADPLAGIVRELRRSPEVISFSFMLYVALSVYSLAMLITRYFVFSRLGELEAGLLQALFGISLALGAVLGPMNNLYLTPLVNRTIPDREKLLASHGFQKKIILLLTVVVLPALLFPKIVLAVLFSPQFYPAAGVLYLFILWQVLYQVVNVYQQLLIGLDDVLYYSVTTAAGFGIAAILCPLLIPPLGLAGAALALIFGILINGLATAVRLQVKFHAGIPAGVWQLILYCLGSIVVAGYLFSQLEQWSLAGFALRILYALGFTFLTWRLLNQEEQFFFISLARRFLPRWNSSSHL